MFYQTDLLSPVIRQGRTKAPVGSYEHTEWYREEARRCIEGYSIGDLKITGRHYWYLNWWIIKGLSKGATKKTLIPPRFIDVDHEFFWEFEYALRDKQHFMCAKRRQVGATEKVASMLGHEFTFSPGSQSVIVAGEEKYSVTALSFVLRGLNNLAGSEFYQQKNPGDDGGLTARYKQFDPDGKGWSWKGTMAQLLWFTAKNNTQVVSSKSPSLILFEECGVFKGLKETFGYVSPSLEDQDQIVGNAIFLGTGGEMDEGAKDFGEMFYKPELYKIRSYENTYSEDSENSNRTAFFIPGWKYKVIDENGNSDKEASIRSIMKTREDDIRLNDHAKLLKDTIAFPLSPEEVFLIMTGNRFNQAKLNFQRAEIMKKRSISQKTTRVSIDWLYDGVPRIGKPLGMVTGIDWKLDPDGLYSIMEFPDLNSAASPKPWYFGGTDSYDKDKAPTSNSKGSCSIFDGKRLQFVARITERPETAAEFYEMTAKLCMMYGCKNLIEWSNIRIFDWYEKMGLEHLLKEKPQIAYANVITTTSENKYGIEPSTKNTWLNLYKDYIEVYSSRMNDLEQVTKALLWQEKKDYNCDITISSSLAYLNYVDEIEYIDTSEDQKFSSQEKSVFLYYKRTANGFSLTH